MDVRLRAWRYAEHIRHIDEGEWTPMYDHKGRVLHGIEGKQGVRGRKDDGSYIGADFIRMQAGAAFPLHTHGGDHELYVIDGTGFVHIDGKDILVTAGDMIHIPAEYTHNVWVPDHALAPLIFVAAGHPHIPTTSKERMQPV